MGKKQIIVNRDVEPDQIEYSDLGPVIIQWSRSFNFQNCRVRRAYGVTMEGDT